MGEAKSRTMLPARLPRCSVSAYYKWIAPFHDLLAVLVESNARTYSLRLADIRDGELVLEAAVGTGLSFVSIVSANASGHSTGIDLTPAMLRRATRKLSDSDAEAYDLTIGDVYSLSFDNEYFDLVYCSYMLDMLSAADITIVLDEFSRVLKPGGRIVLVYMAIPPRWYNKFWELLYRIHPFFLGGCRGIRIDSEQIPDELTIRRREFVSQLAFPSEILVLGKAF